MVPILLPLYLAAMVTVPLCIAAAPVLFAPTPALQMMFLALSPLTFLVSYLLTAGLLSQTGRKAIIVGKFPRDLKHPVYGPRRLYAICWNAIYFFTGLYFIYLSVPVLKKGMFRLFGYQGNLDFTIYADAWLRDLPMLHIGKGAYIANKSTIGTNMCLADGSTIVDHVELKDGALIGHMSIIGPGLKLGENSELGVNSALGIRISIGARANIGPVASIHHGVRIGTDVEVGACSYVGLRASIADGIKIPTAANIPPGASIKSQEDVAKYYSSETAMLTERRADSARKMFAVGNLAVDLKDG
ncbi:MAG: hypothetical protein A2X94_01705 [Bdellovibrionales bacterium GWB1_55_8]|nr:MAG: hypothetical protein A2X94_01705 [Bdellovibrionales bacterium GWB1_55_8]